MMGIAFRKSGILGAELRLYRGQLLLQCRQLRFKGLTALDSQGCGGFLGDGL